MNTRQRARSVETPFFGLCFLFFVSLSKFHRHRFEIKTMLGIGGVFQAGILELFQQKGHALKAIAAMAVATVREEAEHGFVDLDATRRLRSVGCHRTFKSARAVLRLQSDAYQSAPKTGNPPSSSVRNARPAIYPTDCHADGVFRGSRRRS